MTDLSHHLERIREAHTRLDRHEGRLSTLESHAASEKMRAEKIELSLSEIKGGITWLQRSVLGAIVAAGILFIIKGGFYVP